MHSDRRKFLGWAAAAGIGRAQAAAAGMPKRPLGRTGLEVSIMGLGGARAGVMGDHKAAGDVIRLCYDLGVNYFDAAAAGSYGLSQMRFGLALGGLRDKIVLATKTRHRTFTQAELDLNQSLSLFKTDRIDLYQVHNVMTEEDVEFIFGPKGVMEMIEKAKKAGKIRFIGVTGHTDPLLLNKVIERYPFDTVLMPLSISDGAGGERSFERTTLPLARKKGMGIIAMKVFGVGAILKKASAEEALSYALSLPVSTAILGCDRPEQVRADAACARTAKPLSASEMGALRKRFEPAELAAFEPWKAAAPAGPPVYRAD